MNPRIFILAATALLILLEVTFLPCTYINSAMPYRPDAGYHTFSHINTEMAPDASTLAYEVGFTLVLGVVAFAVVHINAKGSLKKETARTWRSDNT